MALDTYDNLVKEVIDWSHRSDLGTKIADFIRLAEVSMFANNEQPLMIRSMETISDLTVDARLITLPADFESARSFRLEMSGLDDQVVKFTVPSALVRHPGTGLPYFFTIIGGQIEFDRTPDQTYTGELQYFAKPAGLSDANQSNVVLADNPNVYLFGALTALFSYAQDDQQTVKYSALFIEAIKGANKSDKKGRFGPNPAMTLQGCRP